MTNKETARYADREAMCDELTPRGREGDVAVMFKPIPKDFDWDAYYLARGAPSQKQIIEEAMASNGEQWADIEYIAIENMADLDRPCWGKSYTIWTKRYVYFPATYDGDNWTEFVSRNPCDVLTGPVGG